MRRLRHPLPCLAAVLALAACNWSPSKEPEVDPRLQPVDYRGQILRMLPKLVEDVSGMRDTAITPLALTQVGDISLYAACVRFNPRKSKTEYAGVQERFAIFHGGYLAQFIPAASGQCAKAEWQPFPELEKLCTGNCPRS